MATLLQLAGDALAIEAAVLVAVAQDYGAFDLTVAGRTAVGRFDKPPTYPFFAIDPVAITSEDDAAPLGAYEKTITFFIEGWISAAASTTASAATYGMAMAGGIVGAIQDAHQESGGGLKALGTRRVNVSDLEFMNTETANRKEGHFRATLEIVYKVISGGLSGI